jgi:anaerobic selenocysteine-containing dehydrogenase
MIDNRPVSHHTWNGIVQHANSTQTGRAIEVFYALLGDWDRPGGNVLPSAVRTTDIGGGATLSAAQAALRLGREEKPLGPPSVPPGNIAAYDLYEAILESRPYQVRALLSFGGNPLLNTGDPVHGRDAFQRLEFFAQAEMFHTPTNAYADVLLPATSFLENDVLIIKDGLAERRRPAVEPLYERRPDVQTIFDLATRLGLADVFAGGDVEAAYDDVLAPAGLSWAALLDQPHGAPVAPATRYEKHAELDDGGRPRGFPTETGKVELFLDGWVRHGQQPLPVYEEPAESPVRTPDLARDYPIVLTNAKRPQYLHSQHRGVTALRRSAPNPTVEIHPDTATKAGIIDGAWVMIETPRGRARAKADVNAAIAPGVACANHGWWEACEALGFAELNPFDERGANVNLLVHNDVRDPISGSIPHRSSLCRLVPLPAEGPV